MLRKKSLFASVIFLSMIPFSLSFGQAKNAIALDIVPSMKGFIASDFFNNNADEGIFSFGAALSYERVLSARASINPLVIFSYAKNDKFELMYFSCAVYGRYYPLSTSLAPDKFFISAGIGAADTLVIDKDDEGTLGLIFSLKTGWKIIPSNNAKRIKVFAEPTLEYVLAKTNTYATPLGIAPLGWQIGLNLGLAF